MHYDTYSNKFLEAQSLTPINNKTSYSKSNSKLKYFLQIPNFQYENVKYWIADENKKCLAVWFSCDACHKTFMDLKKEIGFILGKDDIFTFAA